MPTVRGRSIRVLFDAATIARRNAELARDISAAGYADLLVVSILKGSFIFAADLIRALLLAGIRSAFLWRQLGGRRWKLLFRRRRLLALSRELSRNLGSV